MDLLGRLREALGPSRRAADHYRCADCDRTFVYRADLPDPTCPYCESAALDRVDPT